MSNRTLGFVIAAVVFALDQLSKWIVVYGLDLPNRGEIVILPIFKFLWVNNAGVSLGLFTAKNSLEGFALAGATGLIALFVLVWLWREANRKDVFGLGLILGGAIGNILDRIRTGIENLPLDKPGHVVDFANLHFGDFSPFLVFNIADAAITIGVLILLLRALMSRDTPKADTNA
jgi:signal peptidase II